MQLIRGLNNWSINKPCVATIGNFDGVHLGHQSIVKQLKKASSTHQLPSCVISFEPLPHEFFSPNQHANRLHGFRDKIQTLSSLGVDYFLLLKFDEPFSEQSAQQFIEETLHKTLNIKHLIIGDDFQFGKGRQGNFDTLHQAGQQHGFNVEQTHTVSLGGSRISSTRIRKHLAQSELDQAVSLLGRPYRISGRVVHGEKVGRQLGFPTANVALKKHRPSLCGVFAVTANVEETGIRYNAVANLGERPTVGGRKLLLEVHMLDAEPDLYGQHIQVDFQAFLRGEQKFNSLDELKQAISNDAVNASRFLNTNT